MTPEETRFLRLTSTRATTTSMYSLRWRVHTLLKSLGESVSEESETSWQQKRRDQAVAFVSGITDTVLHLQGLASVEEKAAFLQMLKAEIGTPQDKYTVDQRDMMKRTYEEIENKLGGAGDVQKLTPEWFIPWFELIVDKGTHLGAGGFGSVCRATWLDSEVVVKEVLLPGSVGSSNNTDSYDSLLTAPTDQMPTYPAIADKRIKARAMFRREADIWFRFSHPHVVRLFGACHIGRPFFVCEYATHGTLDSYLRKHPDELWLKLREAALGLQYLHARGVVHGDLKCNNIVVGSDKKAKVTDFGLSSASDSKESSPISGASHWVAPECLVSKKSEKGEEVGARPTFESDVSSLGMCIVEAMRVVEAAQSGKPSRGFLPWGLLDNQVVKYHASRGDLPPRPKCEDDQWELVRRMCSTKPKNRIKISTVVDEIERLAKMTIDTIAQADQVSDTTFVEFVTFARHLLDQLRGNIEQQNDSLASLYSFLWDRIEDVHEQIVETDRDSITYPLHYQD